MPGLDKIFGSIDGCTTKEHAHGVCFKHGTRGKCLVAPGPGAGSRGNVNEMSPMVRSEHVGGQVDETPRDTPAVPPAARASSRTRAKAYSKYKVGKPVAPTRTRAIRTADGCWAKWTLSCGAKVRNAAVQAYGLTKGEADDLKKASRRAKQQIAQRHYIATLREREANVQCVDFRVHKRAANA